jgi:Rps23 Pro-64 3,4-dihydroxylase Tpa1-like proline 4-hydroxylase
LPDEWALAIRNSFPQPETMTLKKSLRERKFIAAQLNQYDPLLEEAVYAFQTPQVVRALETITGLQELEVDELLYAGGVSLMAPGHFLNPHIDNSHDKFRRRYRILNLLYYVSPGWELAHGSNLELWPHGVKAKPVTLVSRFNRLVVMVTHRCSWHSVSPNRSKENRCCVSNYYFSKRPLGDADYFHVTSFRGRPEQPLRDLLLRGDAVARLALRRLFPLGIAPTHHYYARGGGA